MIEEILRDKGLHHVVRGNDILICCLNPDHEDSNPSLRIDKDTGKFHCFACGFKGNIFSFFNLEQPVLTGRIIDLKERISKMRIETVGLEIPGAAIPFEEDFRGISASTYKHFKVFKSDLEFPDRLVIPITNASGKILAFSARYQYSDAKPKYVIYPRGIDIPLFPAKLDKPGSSIILVEGIFDMLNLYDKGLRNVVCTFGTQKLSLKNVNERLHPYLIMGVTKVFVLFDGDHAGVSAANKVKEVIELKTKLKVQVLDVLPEGKDPGDLTQAEVNYIKAVASAN